MATVTKPIALDESLNTTEQTPRNIADVLAEELSAIITAIGGLNFINFEVVEELPTTGISTTTIYLVPSDDPQSGNTYDEYINLNGTVGGWEKIGSTDIDLSGYYTSAETDTLLSGKVDKVNGKGLSTNDYTDAEKTKLSGIESGAEVNVQSDWNQTDNTKDDYIKNKPSSEVKSATDTFTTVNGGLLEECIIKLEPVQSGSGDPSPDNVRPITGHMEVDLQRDGKNHFDGTLLSGYYESNAFNLVGDGNVFKSLKIWLKAGTYTISYGEQVKIVRQIADGVYRLLGEDTNKWTVTLSQDGYFGLSFRNETSTTWNTSTTIQIEKGNQPTAFEPYLGHLYQVQIGQTVYGGYVDLVSGVMMATFGIVELDSLAWVKYSPSGGELKKYMFVTTEVTNNGCNGTRTQSATNAISSNYQIVNRLTIYNDTPLNGMSAESGALYIADTRIDANTTDVIFKTYLSGATLCYELATPITIQLTPQQIETLVGQNNLSTPLDGQSIDSVKYREVFAFTDVEKVVSLRVPISMLGTDESGRTTASQSYASGDYFYKDGYMCKALTSISAGATLTLNTNYSQGTLADILKAIENA